MSIWVQYVGLWKALRRYYSAYGGVRSIITSPIFALALLITCLSYNSWKTAAWVTQAQAILPNMLGFSLGTYSILLTLLNERMREAMTSAMSAKGISALSSVNATFLHFILVQILAILWSFQYQGSWLFDLFAAIDTSVFPNAMKLFSYLMITGSFVGNLLFMYALSLAISAAMSVYRLATLNISAGNANNSDN